jgi:starch synthase
MLLTGLDWKFFNWRQLEFYGNLNLLKAGIAMADTITTVSPRYADEIQHPELGCGLEGILHHRSDALHGILNGVDYSVWNPEIDEMITQKYDVESWKAGKAANKAALQRDLGLAEEPTAPLLGFVGRLAEQKGAMLIADVMQKWASRNSAQWVLLGTGDPELERHLSEIASNCPRRVAVHVGFSEAMAHRIEAAADIFLMPSRYEPCGLNQMYSLKYGAVPIVHETGGLADTITDANPATLGDKTANGFSFVHYNAQAFEQSLIRAREIYHDYPQLWGQIVMTGMQQDWSWRRSAERYAELYEQTIQHVKQTVLA